MRSSQATYLTYGMDGVVEKSTSCQKLLLQGVAMTVLGMAGWGVVFLAAPRDVSGALFAIPSGQVSSRPSVAAIQNQGRVTSLRASGQFDREVMENTVQPQLLARAADRVHTASVITMGNMLVTLSPIVLAVAGLWAAWQRLTNPPAPRYAFATVGSTSAPNGGKDWSISIPTMYAATTATSAGTAVADAEAAPKKVPRQPGRREASLESWVPEGNCVSDKDYGEISKQHVIALGVTVHKTPVEIREKLAVPKEDWPLAIDELVLHPHLQEAAVLSTCNRFEVYAVAPTFEEGVRDVVNWMTHRSGVSAEELRPYLFLKQDGDAVDHILQVSAGLDSLIVGEGQILAQVKSVHEIGSESKGFGQYLAALFMQAITAGKRVRAETNIATGAVSVSSAAAELAQMKLPTKKWEGVSVAIIGAGKMSKLLVKHLVSKGCLNMTIVNRSLPRAQELQQEFPEANIKVELSPKMMDVIAASDVIFVASSSTEILVQASDVATMPTPPELVGGQRRFFDISVPRNTSRDLNELPTAHVYNVDDLKEVVELNKEARAQAASEALVLLKEEKSLFEAWMASLQAVPTIKRLRGKAETIRLTELEKAKSKLGDDLSAKQIKVLEDLSRGIMNKMLHAPMQALRSEGDVQAHVQTINVLGRVFGLSEEDETPRVGK